MGKLVFAGAISHAPGATGWPEKAPPHMKENFYRAAEEFGRRIKEAKPDVLIAIANDHVQNFNIRNFPHLAINLAKKHPGPGEWFKPWLKVPDYEMEGAPELAAKLYNGMVKKGVTMANSLEPFQFDDNMSVPLTLAKLTTSGIPFIPIHQNCTVPPVISSREAYELGKKFREVFEEEFPDDVRVAFMATGGLSHEPGGPKYLLVDEAYDRWVLNHLANSDHETIVREVTYESMEAAGAGGTAELLSWLVVMGAAGQVKCEVLCYEPIQEWRCGMGAVTWKLDEPFVPAAAANA